MKKRTEKEERKGRKRKRNEKEERKRGKNKTKVICANSKFELRNVHCGRGCVSELRV